jgi:hypothetical protein
MMASRGKTAAVLLPAAVKSAWPRRLINVTSDRRRAFVSM